MSVCVYFEVNTQINSYGNFYYKGYRSCVIVTFPLVQYPVFASAGEENKNIKQMVAFPRIIWSPEVYDFFTWGSFVVPD